MSRRRMGALSLLVATSVSCVYPAPPSRVGPSGIPLPPPGFAYLVPSLDSFGNPVAGATGPVFLEDTSGNDLFMTVEVLQVLPAPGSQIIGRLGPGGATPCAGAITRCFEFVVEVCVLANRPASNAQFFLSDYTGQFRTNVGEGVNDTFPCTTINWTRLGSSAAANLFPPGDSNFLEVRRTQFDREPNGNLIDPVEGRAALYLGYVNAAEQ